MRRLALRLLMVSQVDRLFPILFHEPCVSGLTRLECPQSNDMLYFGVEHFSCRILALFDMNPNFPQPADILKYPSLFFVIGGASEGVA